MDDREWLDKAGELIRKEAELLERVPAGNPAQSRKVILETHRRLADNLEAIDPERVN